MTTQTSETERSSWLEALRKHALVVWLFTAMAVAAGAYAAYRMPSGIYPDVEFPRIVIVARSGGATPDVFLTSVTRPLEQALTQVLGLERIRSKTIRGATEISLQFEPSTDMWRALQMVDSRVAGARGALPADAEIIVERVTTGSFPVVTFNVAGHVDPRELRELADFVLRPSLAAVPGAGRIETLGGDVREIEVVLRPESLASLRMSPFDVAERVRTSMGLNAVGRVDRDRQSVTVVHNAQPKTLDDIRAMPIATTPAGGITTVGDIAEVLDGAEDRTLRIGGPHGETVSVSVARMPGASTTDVVRDAIVRAHELSTRLPHGITIEPVYDQAALVEESIASVRDAIMLGLLLCVVLIGAFLRDLRAGAIAAVSVPLTLVVSCAFMRLAHQSINLMSLGGMAVGVGLVVDDTIVVIEAILVRRDEGRTPWDAAFAGTRDLARAVIGTTVTTAVVFVPLAFLDGLVGDFFRTLAFTLVSAVLVSLVVALVLVPLAAGRFLRARVPTPEAASKKRYEKALRVVVGRPALAALTAVLLLVGGGLVARNVQRGFLPTMDEGAFVLDYFLPAGTSLDATESYARKIEDELAHVPEVATFTRRTGAEMGPAAATLANRGDVMVRLKPRHQRQRSAEAVIADVRDRLHGTVPEVRTEFVQVLQDVINDLAGSPRPIEVKFFGTNYEKLEATAAALAVDLESVPGLVDLYAGTERESPEVHFEAKRDETARLGATQDDVSAQLQTAMRGTRVGWIRRDDRLVNVRARYADATRFDAAEALDLPFIAQGHVTSFRAVSSTTYRTAASQRMHEAMQPVVILTADHEGRDLGSVADDVAAVVARAKIAPDIRVELGGQLAGERQTTRQLLLVAAAAAFLVSAVLALQFRRFRLALLVLAAVPIAVVGAACTLVVFGTPLNASSLMGCVLLVGLVVKNGVLLLEEAERLADEGLEATDAVVQAGGRRFRPVLMTTLATLAGLLPLALGIGAGSELQRPLAIAVIGGLVSSTLATLFLLPPLARVILRRSA